MKRKLKRDLPFARAGEIFNKDDDGHWYTDTMCNDFGFIDSVLEKWKDDTDWFEPLPEVPTRWRAQSGDRYWSVGINPEWTTEKHPELVSVYYGTEAQGGWDDDNYNGLNYFRTEEQADSVAGAIKSLLQFVSQPYEALDPSSPSSMIQFPGFFEIAKKAHEAVQTNNE